MTKTADKDSNAPQQEAVEKLSFSTYLDGQGLSRAQRSFYEKHYKQFVEKENSTKEWNKIVNFIH